MDGWIRKPSAAGHTPERLLDQVSEAAVRNQGSAKALTLGSAAGLVYGLQAAVTKTFVNEIGGGMLSLVTNWSVYVLIVSAVTGFVLQQSALKTRVRLRPWRQDGDADAPQPGTLSGSASLTQRRHGLADGSSRGPAPGTIDLTGRRAFQSFPSMGRV